MNEVDEGLPSPALAIKAAQEPESPGTPTKLSADETSIQIQWTAPPHDGSSDLIGYRIYWDDNTGVLLETHIAETTRQTLTFSKSGLQTGQYYRFAISAYNAIGEGIKSGQASIITATVPGAPQTPTLVSQSKTQIGIAWQDPLNLGGTTLDSYVVEMDGGSTSGITAFSEIAVISNQLND